MKKIVNLYFLAIIIASSACDLTQQDYAPEPIIDLDPGVKSVMTRPQSVLLINVLQDIKFNEPVRLSFTQTPSRGKAQFIDLGLIQYQTDEEFLSGRDQFAYQISNTSNQILMQDTVLINIADDLDTLSCGAYYDYQQLLSDTETVIDVLANDVFCGNSAETVTLKISKTPSNGSATIENNKIVYMPSPGFTGSDQLIYELCFDNNDCYFATAELEVISSACETSLGPDSINYYYNFSDTIFYNLLANDLICDSTNVTLELENVPAGNLAFIYNQQLVYYPEQTDFERIQFNYKVCNQGLPCSTEIVTITFADSIQGPACEIELQDDLFDLRSDSTMQSSYQLQVLSNDLVCYEDYMLKIVQAPAEGTIIVHSDYLEFKPEENQAGKTVFDYQVCLGTICYTAEITILL